MLLDEIAQDTIEVGPADLLQVVINPGERLVDLDDPAQVDRGADDHRVAVGAVDGGFQVLQLLLRHSPWRAGARRYWDRS